MLAGLLTTYHTPSCIAAQLAACAADGEPVLATTFRPSAMHAFIRSHRYHPGGSHCSMDDLFAAVKADPELRDASMWRDTRKAMLIAGAYHAGGSRFINWCQPRQKLTGVQLGKGSVADVNHPRTGFDTAEDAVRHISGQGMREMHNCANFSPPSNVMERYGSKWLRGYSLVFMYNRLSLIHI